VMGDGTSKSNGNNSEPATNPLPVFCVPSPQQLVPRHAMWQFCSRVHTAGRKHVRTARRVWVVLQGSVGPDHVASSVRFHVVA